MGTPADRAWLMASMVCGMMPSSAATTRTAMSVTCAPRARIAVNASWPGVSRNVILRFWPLLVGIVHFDLVRADVLGDAAELARGDFGVADGVQQRGLAVVHVAHDGDDGRAGDRPGDLLARLGGDDGDARGGGRSPIGGGRRGRGVRLGLAGGDDVDGDLVALRQPGHHFRAEFLVERGEDAQAHQLFLDVGGRDADQRRKIFQRDDVGDVHLARRLGRSGRRRLCRGGRSGGSAVRRRVPLAERAQGQPALWPRRCRWSRL